MTKISKVDALVLTKKKKKKKKNKTKRNYLMASNFISLTKGALVHYFSQEVN